VLFAVRVFLPNRGGTGNKALSPGFSWRLVRESRPFCRLLTLAVLIGVCRLSLAPRGIVRGITLTVAGFGYQAAERLSGEGLADFVRRTGIHAEFIPSWGTSANQLALILRTLKNHYPTPDVYVIDMIWPGTLQRDLLDLTPYLDDDSRAHLPEVLRNDRVNGRIVSLPLYVNTGLLYYRTDLIKKYGYQRPPATWKELERMAARIQSGERAAGHRAFWGYVWQGGAYEGLTCNALEWQTSFGGGRIIEDDGTISVNNPRTAKALGEAAAWVGSISPPSVLTYTEADSLNAFRSGNAAFLRYWSSGFRSNRRADSAIKGRFDVTLLPAGPHGRAQTTGGFELAVSRYSAHQREAAELVVYLTGSKVQKSRAIREGYLPTIPRLYRDPEILDAVPEASVVERAGRKSWISRPSSIAGQKYSDVSKSYYLAVHRILSHQCLPREGLADLEKELVNLRLGGSRN
jgi:trehalose/maltose transport system substrate-binding protein